MAELKTKANRAGVRKFLNGIGNAKKREDALAVLDMMEQISGEKPKMWGSSIVGFGSYHYRYESGREGDFILTGFSPRKQSLVVYIVSGFSQHAALMNKLGKYKTGKSCLYINKLEDINLKVLKQLISRSVKHIKNKYP